MIIWLRSSPQDWVYLTMDAYVCADSNWALGRDHVSLVLHPEARGLLRMATSAIHPTASQEGDP